MLYGVIIKKAAAFHKSQNPKNIPNFTNTITEDVRKKRKYFTFLIFFARNEYLNLPEKYIEH